MTLRNWWQYWTNQPKTRKAKRFSALLRGLEALEDRTVPATLTWVGDVNSNWNAGTSGVNTNWSGDVLPSSGDTLLFNGAAVGTLTNDTTAGNSYILQFGAGGYTINGNGVTVNASTTWLNSAGANAVNANVTLAGNGTLSVTGTLTMGGAISGASGNLFKVGAGTLILNGSSANTYGGNSTVSAGFLTLSKSANTAAIPGNLAFSSTNTLTWTAANQFGATTALSVTAAGTVQGATGIDQSLASFSMSTGTVNTGAAVITVAGNTSITGGTLNLNSGGTTFSTGTLTMSAGTLNIGNGSAATNSLNIGSGGLVMSGGTIAVGNGAGVAGAVAQLVLNGNVLASGTSTISTAATAGTRKIDLGGATRTFTVNATSLSIAPVIDNGGITKAGAGTLTLTGANTYSGPTLLTGGGKINANNSNAFGTSSSVTIDSTANNQIFLGNGVNINRPLTIQGGSVSGQGALHVPSGSATWSGSINITASTSAGGHFAAASSLTLAGPITSSVQVVFRAGTNIVSGSGSSFTTAAISQGSLRLGATDTLPTNVTLDIAGVSTASFDLFGFDQTVNAITRTAAQTATVDNTNPSSTSTLTVGNNNTTTTFSGIIQNSGASALLNLVKIGLGTFTPTGTNTYAGTTSILNGTLQATTAAGIGNGPTILLGDTTGSNNAKLLLGTSGLTIARDLMVQTGSSGTRTVSYPFATGIGTVSGNVTLNDSMIADVLAGGTFSFGSGAVAMTVGGGTPDISVQGGGTLSLNNAPLTGSTIPGFVSAPGAVYTVIQAASGAISGTFNGLSNGSFVTIGSEIFSINYTASTVTLTDVGNSPSTVYVNDNWSSTAPNTDPDGAGGVSAAYGFDAFSDIATAINNVATGGTIVIEGGSYSGALNFSKPLNFQFIVDTVAGQSSETTANINGAITLSIAPTFSDTGTFTVGHVRFGSTIDGSEVLDFTGTSSTVTFAGAVGATTALTFLTTSATSALTNLNGASIRTVGAQTFNAPVVLGANVALTTTSNGSVNFATTMDADATVNNRTLTISANGTGTVTFSGAVGSVGIPLALTVTATEVNSTNTITVGANGLSITNTGTASTLAGVVSGSGGLTKAGAGSLILNAANTYSGATNINNGTLTVVTGGNLANTASVAVGSAATSATLNVNTAGTVTLGTGNVSLGSGANTGTLNLDGGATLNVSGAITSPGVSVINANNGTLNIASGLAVNTLATAVTTQAAVADVAVVNVNGGAVFIGTGTQALSIGRRTAVSTVASSTSGTLNLAGAASVTINVNNLLLGTYTQATSGNATGDLTSGTLTLSAAGTNNVTVASAGSLTLGDSGSPSMVSVPSRILLGNAANNINAGTVTIGGRKGSGEIKFSGTGGTLDLRGATGGASTAALNLGNNSTSATGTSGVGSLNLAGGTFNGQLAAVLLGFHTGGGGGSGIGVIVMDAGTVSATGVTLGNGDAASTSGTLTLNGGTFSVNGALANATSGSAIVNQNGGTLRFNSLSRATGTFAYNFNAGTIETNSGADLTDSNVAINLLTAGTHTFNITAGRQATIGASASLAGVGGLDKTGPGTLIFAGANSFSGNSSILQGSVLTNASGALGTSSAVALGDTTGSNSANITIASAGVTINRNITVQTGSSGTKALSYALTSGTGTFSGTITANDTTTLDVQVGGTLSLNGGALVLQVGGATPTVLVQSGGAVSLTNAALNATTIPGFVSNPGAVYTIIQATASSITGAFNGLPNGSLVTIGTEVFTINYTATAVTLTDVGSSPTTVYVNDNWSNTTPGADPDGPGGVSATYGFDAFSDIPSALSLISTGGTIVVEGGTYAAAINLNKAVSFQFIVDTVAGQGSESTAFLNGAITLAAAVSFSDNGTFTVGNVTFGSTIDGAQVVDFTGSSSVATFNGVVGNTTALGSLTTSGTASVTNINTSTIRTSGSQAYNAPVVLGANTSLTTTSNGSVSFASTVDGDSTANNRTLTISANGTGNVSFGGAVGATGNLFTLTVAADDVNASSTITYGNGGLSITNTGGASTLSGVISGSGTITKAGTGTLTLAGANNFIGAVNVQNGTLKLSSGPNRIPTASTVTLGTGTSSGLLDLNGQDDELAGLLSSGTGTNNRVLNSGAGTPTLTLNIASAATNNAYTGFLGNAGQNSFNLTKAGPGTLTLSTAHTFTGATSVFNGMLTLATGSNLAGTSGVTVGTLATTGNVNVTATGSVTVGGSLNLGNGGTGTLTQSAGTLTIAGGISDSGNSSVSVSSGSLNITSGLAVDTLSVALSATAATALVTVNGGAVNIGSGSGNLDVGNATATTTAVGTLDLRNASSVNINVANVNIGQSTNNTGTFGTVRLSLAGSNSITAGTITIGNSPSAGNTGVTSALFLGDAVNNVTATTVYVGRQKANGMLAFNATGGTLNLAATNLLAGYNDAANTGTQTLGTINLSGGTFNSTGTINSIVLGLHAGTGTGWGRAALTIDAGSVTTNGLTLGSAGSETTQSNIQGTLTLNGGTLAVTGNIVNVNGGTALISHNGGTLTFNNLTKTATGPFTYNWNGGTIQTNAGTNLADTNVAINLLTAATHTINVLAGRTATINTTASIANSGALTKDGAGTLALAGANAYAGGTTVNGGFLQANGAGATGAGSVDVNNTAILGGSGSITGQVNVNNGAAINPGAIGAVGTLTVANNVFFNTGSLYQPDVNGVSADLLSITGAGNDVFFSTTPTLPQLDPNYLAFASGNTVTIIDLTNASAMTAGFGNIPAPSGGPLNVSGKNISYTYAGGSGNDLTISAAATTFIWDGGGSTNNWNDPLNWTNDAIPSSGDSVAFDDTGLSRLTSNNNIAGLSLTSFTINNTSGNYNITGSAVTLTTGLTDSSTGSQSNTVGLAINGTGATLNKSGSTTLILSAANGYTGATTIGAGTLQIGAGGTTGSLGTVGVTNNGALVFNHSDNISVANVISGSGGVTQAGTGTLTLSGSNSYTGTTTISAGTLSAATLANGGTNSNIGASTNAASNLVLNGGTLRYTGAAVSSDRLFTLTQNGGGIDASGTGALNLNNTGAFAFTGSGARTLVLTGTSTGANTLAAILGDAAVGQATSLVKNGAGQWILSGNNSYDGGTTVNGAGGTTQSTLTLANNNAAGTGAIVVNSNTGGAGVSGTRLALTGGVNVSNPLTLPSNAAGDIRSNLFSAAGTNTYSGQITLTGNGAIAFAGAASTTLNINGGVVSSGYTGALNIARGTTTNTTNVNSVINVPGANVSVANGSTAILKASGIWGNTSIDGGTLTIATGGDLVSTTGSITVGNSAATGTLNVTSTGSVTLGASNVNIGGTGTGILNITGGGTVSILGAVAESGTSSLNVDNGSLTIGTGLAVDNLRVGFTSTATSVNADLTVSSGAVAVVGAGNILVGQSTNTGSASGTADFSDASSVSLTAGTLQVGTATSSGTGVGTLTLSWTGANSVTATSITVGDSVTASNTAGLSLLTLGTASNTLTTNSLLIGGRKSRGTVQFASGGAPVVDLNPRTATSVALNIGDNNTTGTGTFSVGILDLTGGTFNANLGAVILGRVGTGASGAGAGQGTLTMDAGSVTATSVTMATTNSAPSANNAGTLNLHGGTFAVSGTIANAGSAAIGTGTINQSGGTLRFGSLSRSNGVFNYNWSAGTLQNNTSANLTDTNVTLTLSTAGPHTIDISTGQTGAFNAASALVGSGPLDKIGAGTLALAGTNTFLGNVTIQAGTIDVSNGAAIADANHIFVQDPGMLNLSSNETVGALSLFEGSSTGAQVTTGVSTLSLTGDIDVQVNGTGAVGAVISGNLNLNGATRTFTVVDGAAAIDLEVNAAIVNSSGTAGILLPGLGTTQFSGAGVDTYNGNTTVNGGTLLLNKSGGGDKAIPGGILSITSATVSATAGEQIATSATLNINSGATFSVGDGAFTETVAPVNFNASSSRVEVIGGSTLATTAQQNQPAGLLYLQNGTFQVGPSTYLLYNLTGGKITGAGNIVGNVSNGAVIDPGTSIADHGFESVGTINIQGAATSATTVTGNYTQTAGATLKIDYGAAAVDRLNINGTVYLDGTLSTGQLASYNPSSSVDGLAFMKWGIASQVPANSRRLANPSNPLLGPTAPILATDFAVKQLHPGSDYFEARYTPTATVSGTFLNPDTNSDTLSLVRFAGPASNISTKFAVSKQGLVGNTATKVYTQTVTLTNTSGAAITGPIYYEITQYGAAYPVPVLLNRQGLTQNQPVDPLTGKPRQYLLVSSGATPLANGQSVTFQLKFYKPSLTFQIVYNQRVLGGGAP